MLLPLYLEPESWLTENELPELALKRLFIESFNARGYRKKVASHQKIMPCCSYGAFVLKIKNMNLLGIFFTSVKWWWVFLYLFAISNEP